MPRYAFIATLAFDDEHDEPARRAWLAELRTATLARAADTEDAFEDLEVHGVEPSGGWLEVVYDADLPAASRRARLRDIADRIEAVRTLYPGTLPESLTFKHRMAQP